MKTKFLSVLLLATLCMFTKAQMNNWVMPPYEINMTGTSPSAALSLPGSSPYIYGVANGAYDQSGALLFYVQDNYIFDSGGNTVGSLGVHNTSSGWHVEVGGEIVIVPIPGECKKFYVIYSVTNVIAGGYYVYVKVDCTGSSPVVQYAGTPSGSFYPAFPIAAGDNNNGLAVSKKTGTGSSATYHLYASTNNGIFYHTISATGISSGTLLYNTTSTSLSPELELSANGQWLAWAIGGGVYILGLNSSGTAFASIQNFNFSGTINGLEFAGSFNSPDLYVAGNQSGTTPIFNRIQFISTPNSNTSLTSLTGFPGKNLNSTFLEYAKNGKIYGIYNSGTALYLLGYDITTQAISTTPLSTDSKHGNLNNVPFLQNVYTLPDQIDGEDYDNFTTNPLINISSLTVNGLSAPFNGCNGIFQEVYNCAPINVDAVFEGGTPCYVQMDILSHNENCEYQSGSGYFNYSSALPNTVYAAAQINDYDVRDLFDRYEESLYTLPGYYVIALTIKDCCGNESTSYFPIKVLPEVSPAVNLKIYDYTNPGTYMSFSHNYNSPNLVGAALLGFSVPGNAGMITSMNVLVENVDAFGNSVGSPIINETVPMSNVTSIPYQGLNSYCVPTSIWGITPPTPGCGVSAPASYSGYKSYFIYNNATNLGNTYKLTVTLSNPCSSYSEYSFLKINDAWSKPTGITQEENTLTDVQVYPNPASDILNVKIKAAQNDSYTIVLFDLGGRLMRSVKIEDGGGKESVISINTDDLDNGIYLWEINSKSSKRNGKVNVMR